MAQSLVTEEKSLFLNATYVDWSKYNDIEKLKKNLRNQVKKDLNTEEISINRINSFMITVAEFSKELEINERKNIEANIKSILKDYAGKLNKQFRKEIVYNGDTEIYTDAFEELDLPFDNLLQRRQHDVVDDIEVEIEKIISHANLSIWDFPGNDSDRIILPDLIVTIDDDANETPSLANILDELIITNLSRYFIPFSYKLLKRTLSGLNMLENLTSDYERYGELSYHSKRAIMNIIGHISGLQESLKLLKRQVNRISTVLETALEEFSLFPSTELDAFAEYISELKTSETRKLIERLNTKIKVVKHNLRRLLKNRNEKQESLSDVFEKIIEIKSITTGLVQWVHRFQELPAFTTMSDGLAFEMVENEVYEPSNPDALIEVKKLFKLYRRGGSTVYALRGIDLQIKQGEFVIIQGHSGAGKTTLLNIMAGLDDSNRGTVFFEGNDLIDMSDSERTRIRRDHFSFIFQNYALIPHLDAIENVKIPLELSGISQDLHDEVIKLLDDVGIGEYADHKPAYLSGGQQQRLGIARALIKKPKVLFADEPTGDLDSETGQKIMRLLKRYHEETGITIVLVTHNPEISKFGTRVINMEDGQIVSDDA